MYGNKPTPDFLPEEEETKATRGHYKRTCVRGVKCIDVGIVSKLTIPPCDEAGQVMLSLAVYAVHAIPFCPLHVSAEASTSVVHTHTSVEAALRRVSDTAVTEAIANL